MVGPKSFIGVIYLAILIGTRSLSAQAAANPSVRAAELRARIEATRELAFKRTRLLVRLPAAQELGMISWLAYDSQHKVIWLIQRLSLIHI